MPATEDILFLSGSLDISFPGDVFKEVARRTRRSSGLPSALCRPCDEVYPLVHEYVAPAVADAAARPFPGAAAAVAMLFLFARH